MACSLLDWIARQIPQSDVRKQDARVIVAECLLECCPRCCRYLKQKYPWLNVEDLKDAASLGILALIDHLEQRTDSVDVSDTLDWLARMLYINIRWKVCDISKSWWNRHRRDDCDAEGRSLLDELSCPENDSAWMRAFEDGSLEDAIAGLDFHEQNMFHFIIDTVLETGDEPTTEDLARHDVGDAEYEANPKSAKQQIYRLRSEARQKLIRALDETETRRKAHERKDELATELSSGSR